ncbi:hypothetical protein ACSAZL_01215 [Methanosarcina sp. T3]|uniref:hypothetical protein n=1 Tax=Methanosarcina sp. T3 TaxID=3439062 RepID=UPI003F858907
MSEGEINSEIKAEEAPFIPSEPNPFWKKNAEKIVGESISSIEDTAKQFVTINGVLQGIYFHAIAFSDMKNTSFHSVLIYASPLVLWFLSLFFAVLVLFRNKYNININSSKISKKCFEKIVTGKYRLLWISGIFLVLSFAALIIAFLRYLSMV